MRNIKNGDIVSRNSYGNDIFFEVKNIFKFDNRKTVVILKGIDIRIEADALIDDLRFVDKGDFYRKETEFYLKLERNIEEHKKFEINKYVHTGKILHLDGDKKYSEKSKLYYSKLGLNAIVKNVPENKQPRIITKYLTIYDPEILVITGHDGMIKKGTRYNDILNYRSSRHFVQCIKEARIYDRLNKKRLVIFAGACQSYFEALIEAGANFASSPGRILIDFLDPLIVAKNIAITDKHKYITTDDFIDELRDGKQGVDGIGAMGKKNSYSV